MGLWWFGLGGDGLVGESLELRGIVGIWKPCLQLGSGSQTERKKIRLFVPVRMRVRRFAEH